MRHIPKNKQRNKCACIQMTIRLILMKLKMEMKNRSHRYDLNTFTIVHKIFETNSSFHVK